ncbi:MBL fold metallo-hydrolase [Fulvivirga sedimenti]|uniref:MBL fold metallo-hydrolase n=1 Tax=Fulvivirga sedimenti TaxID=2879465 RepID=A0A9X1KW37_9BACT|nr:MBL fold metallo-hydrolase [Fulvivirga sedimenti]MCA6073564.1 MBL fold metallo-hydrolase [Fulvivirga sedimenti]
MKVEQIYTGCLAEAAYYIESNGEAAIVDPLREVSPYIEMAEERGAKIKYVLETHFHADFVSGHIDLAKKTGAEIVFGPNAQPNYEAHIATDGEILHLGDVQIKVLHTPGHTMESTTYLLIDEEGEEHSIFTGDTLFIGDVGRPDLAVKTDLSREDLASHLYDSLREKIMPLGDEVIVYPGHGAGSACGKNMSKETFDTLGHQKITNYALRKDMTREEFVKEVTENLVEPPQYFPKNAVMNKMGYESFDEVLNQGNTPLSAKEFETVANSTGALVLDTRDKDAFAKEHIPGSIFIGIDDNFAPWVGALIVDLKQAIVFIAEEGREEEVVTRLSRVGYDNTLGYLKGGIEAWKKAGFDIDTIDQVTAFEFAKGHKSDYSVLDVRKESEYESQHVEGTINFPLDFINRNMAELDRDQGYYLHCQGGYRSLITASILRSRGFEKIVNIKGGFNALKETDLKLTEFHEPLTLL